MTNPNTFTTDAMKTTSQCNPNLANANLEWLKYEVYNHPSVICATAAATADKSITLTGVPLSDGLTLLVSFTNANTAVAPTLNVNSTGAKAIYNEAGTAVSATNPAYFPAGSMVEFIYDGANWVYKNRIVSNYVNGTSGYCQWVDGRIEQWGFVEIASSSDAYQVTFYKSFKNTNYNFNMKGVFTTVTSTGGANYYSIYQGIGNIVSQNVAYAVVQVAGTYKYNWYATGY